MKNSGNKEIDFELPGDKSVIDTIYDIIKDNGLVESPEKLLDRYRSKKESPALIIRDAALIIFQKKIPDEKLAEILAKHLETSKEIAVRVVGDIKEKLVPYIKIVDSTKDKEASVQEILIEKIKRGIPEDQSSQQEISMPSPEPVKKVQIESVEENAEKLKKQREEIVRPGTIGEELQKKGQTDKYREPIE